MFLLDSLMISGIQWALKTAITAAEAEMNDDTALREALLEAEMRREMGEISDEEFGEIEADLLRRIREIKERREGGSGPLAFGGGAQPMEMEEGSRFQVEAEVSGDFHDPGDTPQTGVVTVTPGAVGEVVVTPVVPPRPARKPARRRAGDAKQPRQADEPTRRAGLAKQSRQTSSKQPRRRAAKQPRRNPSRSRKP